MKEAMSLNNIYKTENKELEVCWSSCMCVCLSMCVCIYIYVYLYYVYKYIDLTHVLFCNCFLDKCLLCYEVAYQDTQWGNSTMKIHKGLK